MKPTFNTVDCIVCGQTYEPTQLMCGDCAQLIDRDLRIRESGLRRELIQANSGWKTAIAIRDSFIRDPEYIELGKKLYAQAKSRIEDALKTGHINDKLRKEGALVHT